MKTKIRSKRSQGAKKINKNIKLTNSCKTITATKKRMADLIFEQVCRLLRENEFDLIINTKTDPFAGYVDYEKNKIYLNPNLYPLAETLIHEIIHILKPRLDEKTVIEMTSLIYEALNDDQRNKLLAYIDALTTRRIGVTKKELVSSA